MPSSTFYPQDYIDTALWRSGGDFSATYPNFTFGGSGPTFNSYVRCPLTGVPKNATIVSAYLSVYAFRNDSGYCPVLAHVALADDQAAPTTADAADALVLSDGISWSTPDFIANAGYQTPSLTALVQQIVVRPGWVPGSHILIALKGTEAGSSIRTGWTLFGDRYSGTYRPSLTVEWSTEIVVAIPGPATGILFSLPPVASWCAEVDAWTDFPSEWSDEETAWQPVSEAAAAGLALVETVGQDATAAPSAVAGPAAAAMTVVAIDATVTTATAAAVTVAVSSVAAALEAIDASAVPLTALLAAAAVLEPAALAAESLAGTAASPGAAALGITPLPVTVSTTIVVVAQVASVAMALSALAPSTASAATAEPGTASLAASARDAIGAALARVEAAAATLATTAQTVGATSASTAAPEAAVLDAILGAYAASPVAIVAPDAATAALVARACEFLADTTAGPAAAILRLAAQAAVAGTGIKEVVRLASPIATSARRASPFTTSWRGASRITPIVRFKSRIEVEQT